eukprot:GHVL01035068.1.p2 GENE.GHVL01035068.1~~GHVL01035068.1.p2  ORF type:complete len:120 (-),score=22.06 GHVL01035068.1:83-442(-)
MRLAGSATQGKPSHTMIKAIKQFVWEDLPYTLVEMRPVYGPRHQMQLHAVSIGHPMVGDTEYAADRRMDGWNPEMPPEHYPRLFLHCIKIKTENFCANVEDNNIFPYVENNINSYLENI